MSKFRKYTVTSKELLTNVRKRESFKTLKEARKVGFQHFRLGTFIKLININGVVLNLM